jgi:hypothetical protein
MKAINKNENYITFNIDEIGQETLNSLIGKALKLCTTISMNDILNSSEIPAYKTQIPYNSGFIQDRFVYRNTSAITEYITQGMNQVDAFEIFFCVYTCLDFYYEYNLILSLNIVQGIITIDSNYIDLNTYGYTEGEPNHE